MVGYVRQSVAEIQDGEEVVATPLNNEFNAIRDAFSGTTGHTHNGTTGNGPKINLTTSVAGLLPVVNGGIGDLSTTDGNFIVGNGSTWITESGSTARTSLGLGSASTANLLDEDDMVSSDATAVPSQQSVKMYVDANIVAATSAQAAAETAQAAAETARDVAYVNADVYADSAAGLTGTSEGDQFVSVDGKEFVRFRHDAGPTAYEFPYRYPSSAYVRDQIDTLSLDLLPLALQRVGRRTLTVGTDLGAPNAGTFALFGPLYRGYVQQLKVFGGSVGGTLKHRVFSTPDEEDFTRSGADLDLSITAGTLTTFDNPDIAFQAGDFLGGYFGGTVIGRFTSQNDDGGFYFASGDQTSFTDADGRTTNSGLTIQYTLVVAPETPQAAYAAYRSIAAKGGGPGWRCPRRGLEAAYSTRPLPGLAYSGPLVNARRYNDTSDTDIGSSGADIDVAAIETLHAGGSASWTPLQVSTVYDQSGNGLDLVWYNSAGYARPTLASSLFNGKPAFSVGAGTGRTQIMQIPDPMALTGDQTIAINFRAFGRSLSTGSNVYAILIGNYEGSSPYKGWAIGMNPSGQLVYWSSGAARFAPELSGVDVFDGAMHRIVLTRASGEIRFYIDGELKTVDWGHSNEAPSTNLNIGAQGALDSFMNSAVSEVLLYSRAWTYEEAIHYCASAQYYWGNDEVVPLTGSHSIRPLDVSSVNCGTVLAYERTQAWTCTAAVRLMGVSPVASILFTNVSDTGPAFPGYEVFVDQYGRPFVRIISTFTGNRLGVYANMSIADGLEHVLAVTYDGSSTPVGIRFWLDGVELTDKTTEANSLSSSIISGTQTFRVGSQTNRLQYYWPGVIDAFRLDDVVRSDGWIEVITRPALIPAPDGDTQLSYDFEEGTGTSIADGSANNYDGTLEGAAVVPVWVE